MLVQHSVTPCQGKKKGQLCSSIPWPRVTLSGLWSRSLSACEKQLLSCAVEQSTPYTRVCVRTSETANGGGTGARSGVSLL